MAAAEIFIPKLLVSVKGIPNLVVSVTSIPKLVVSVWLVSLTNFPDITVSPAWGNFVPKFYLS